MDEQNPLEIIFCRIAETSECCDAPMIYDLPPHGQRRCRACGHRQTQIGYCHTESWRLPPWTWPLEIIGRHLAKKAA